MYRHVYPSENALKPMHKQNKYIFSLCSKENNFKQIIFINIITKICVRS